MKKLLSVIVLVVIMVFISCRKDSFISSHDAVLGISADTLSFDTVFVTAGAITKSFKIFNNNNQKLRLNKVKLAGGSSSTFKINVDGNIGPEVNNIEMEANDSIYVFVTVNVNPSSGNLPFLLRDSISIQFNGNEKFVQLQAYGQNAHFIRNKLIAADTTWTNDLPFVIIGGLQVDTGVTLTIQQGCRIYVNARAPILIDGTLLVNGTKTDSVVFRGDRLDPDYRDLPGSWPGIYFRGSSRNNRLTYAVIQNSYQSVVVEKPSSNSNPKLTLQETIIDNSYDAGILAVNSSINARNCLVSNCGYNLLITQGGNYRFDYCTMASYFSSFLFRKAENRVLTIINSDGASTPQIFDLSAQFNNCIFWGDGGAVEDEVAVFKQGSPAVYNVTFNNSLYKVTHDATNAVFANSIKNDNPLFDSIDVSKHYYNFRLKNNSPAIDKGTIIPGINTDLDNKPRLAGSLPDLGAYEKQ
jgi:hypothetical protein